MDLVRIPISDGGEAPRFIVYRPLARLAFVANGPMADLAEAVARGEAPDGPADALGFLSSIGFLAADPSPEPSPDTEFRPATAVLLMTNQCQLRCTYCYASAGALPREPLPLEVGLAAIDCVAENALALGRPSFELSFHGGGEPTLAWATLVACTAHARAKPLPARVSLTSNGIWSARQLGWIVDNLDSLSLSVDGGPETQDRQRPFASGRGSSAQVLRNIAALDERGFRYGIRLTATEPWEGLPEQIAFLCEHTGCRSIQAEPAFNEARGGHRQPSRDQALAFARAFMQAFDIASEQGRRLYCSGARLGVVSASFCSAPYGALIANARGEMVACYEVAGTSHPLWPLSVLGRIDGSRAVPDEPARTRLHALMADRRASCRDCFCYWTCAGDCYTRTFLPGPDGHLIHGGRCEANRYLTEQLLLRAIARGDGVWQGSRGSSAGDTRVPFSGVEAPD